MEDDRGKTCAKKKRSKSRFFSQPKSKERPCEMEKQDVSMAEVRTNHTLIASRRLMSMLCTQTLFLSVSIKILIHLLEGVTVLREHRDDMLTRL